MRQNKIKSALFLLGFGFFLICQLPFETGRLSDLILLFAFWPLLKLHLQGIMQILGGFRRRRMKYPPQRLLRTTIALLTIVVNSHLQNPHVNLIYQQDAKKDEKLTKR